MQQIPAAQLEMCRKLVAMRKVVGECLGYSFCPSPVWDMLLELYLAERDGRELYLYSLCMVAHVPVNTALRKVTNLEKRGLLVRVAPNRDQRRVGVRLTQDGTKAVTRVLDRLGQLYLMAPASEVTALVCDSVEFARSVARRA